MRGWPRRPHCRPRISGRKERPSIRATVAGEGRAGGTPALRLLREAVEQAVAAGGDEVGLAAAAGLVRGVPGALELVVGAAAAVDVAEFGLAEFAADPVVAGHVHVAGERGAVGLRASQGVVIVGREAETRNPGAALGERVVGGELVVGAVQILDAGRDHHALGVLPRALADAVASVGGLPGRGRGGTEIGPPRLAAGACGGGERLAVGIGARKPAKIAALARTGAGDEERHVRRLRHLLRLRAAAHAEKQYRGRQQRITHGLVHRFSPVGFSNFFEPVAPPEGATVAYFTGAGRGRGRQESRKNDAPVFTSPRLRGEVGALLRAGRG